MMLSGQTWCVTGTFTNYKPRDIALKEIIKNGGTTTTVVNSKTTHLLTGQNPGSKLEKALKSGVTIVTENDFKALVNLF